MHYRFYLLLFSAAMLLCRSAALPAQPTAGPFRDTPQLPAGVTGERIKALLKAFSSDNADGITAFFDKHVSESFRNIAPMEEHVQMFRSVYRMTGGVDFYSIRTYTPPRAETVVIARDRLFGGWHGFSFRLEGPEQRMAGLDFTPARPPAEALAGQTAMTEAAMIAAVRQKMAELCQKDAFSGSILLAKGDKVLFETACGEATKAWHIPNNVDTKFNLGSMNKMFTATAVMQLVEKNRLGLDDPIGNYVDESWLPRSITGRVTVRHLLTHTSGLGSYFNETYERSSRDLFRQVEDYKMLVRDDTLAFEPGSRFRYSNTGMLLLGVVIQKASGENYFDYIRQYIYVPAGMTNSDCYELDHPTPNLAEGYLPAPEGGWKNNLFMHVLKGGPAGGGYSTAGDLHRFARALQDGKLVSKATLDQMWTDYFGEGYGFGFEIQQSPIGKTVGHGGGFPGLNSHLDIQPDGGYIIVVMSNYDMGAEPVRGYLLGMVGRVTP